MLKKIGAFLLAALMFIAVQAADIKFDGLSLEQGFNFRTDVQSGYGYVTALSLNAATHPLALPADISVATSGAARENVVGVLTSLSWGGNVGDPISLHFNVSSRNRTQIQELLHEGLKDTGVSFEFIILQFDQIAHKWYTAAGSSRYFSSSAIALKGNIARMGKDKLLLELPSNLQNEMVKSPENWEVVLTVAPAAFQQSIGLQLAPDRVNVKSWGLTIN